MYIGSLEPVHRLGERAQNWPFHRSRMREQDKRIEELTSQLKEQAAQIEKVSAKLEASKPASQVVNNP